SSPDGGMIESTNRRVDSAGRCPPISARVILAASVHCVGAIESGPDDHFITGPYRGGRVSRRRSVNRAGGYLNIDGRIVSSAGVHVVESLIISAPDNHLSASPYRRVVSSPSDDCGRWRPVICVRIVPAPNSASGRSIG